MSEYQAIPVKHNIFLINIPPDCGFGGCERNLIDYLSQVNYDEHRVTLVTTKDVFTERLRGAGLPVQVLEFPFKIKGDGLKRFGQMYTFLKKLGPDSVVFVHNGFFQFRLPCFLAAFLLTLGNVFSIEVLGAPAPPRRSQKKYFGVIPSMNLWWYKEMVPVIWRGWLSRRILAVSGEVKKRLVEWYHYPEHRIIVEYHGTDVDRFCPNQEVKRQMRQKLGIPQEDTVLVATVRLDRQKRVDRLIAGFGQIYPRKKDAWLIIVGEGPLKSELEEIALQYNVRERVKFAGYQEDIAPYLQMSDIYVLSSDNEGFARVILESMAAALVVVATNVPGVNEIIEDGNTGILVEPSEEGIRDGLQRAFEMSDIEKRAMTSNARQTILKRFNLRKQVVSELKVLDISGVTR